MESFPGAVAKNLTRPRDYYKPKVDVKTAEMRRWEMLKADPERFQLYKDRKSIEIRRRRELMLADPEKQREYKTKQSEYQRRKMEKLQKDPDRLE